MSESGPTTHGGEPTPAARRGDGQGMLANLRPLVIDVAVPLGTYYLCRNALGLGLVTSLALGGVVPAVRSVVSLVRDRRVNGLAALMLTVNVIGIALSFVTGNPRVMLAKDSGISSVIGLCVLLSAFGGRPLMSAGLRPFLVKDDAAKAVAWDRLAAGSARFRALERRFSLVWGTALLAECVVRLIGAFTLPVDTMVWLGTVLTVAAILIAMFVGSIATVPLDKLLTAEAKAAVPPVAGATTAGSLSAGSSSAAA